MCLVRVMVGTPRRWPKLFRFTTTPWGPCTSPERHQPSPPSIPPTSFLPERAHGPPPPHPHPLFPMTAHHTYSTDLPVIHPNSRRNTRPFTCKTQADSTASCTQKVMNIIIIIIVILLFLFHEDYCSFYVEFLKLGYYYVIVLYATFTLLCM